MRQKISFAMSSAAGASANLAEERWVRMPSIDVALLALEDIPAARWDDCWPGRFAD